MAAGSSLAARCSHISVYYYYLSFFLRPCLVEHVNSQLDFSSAFNTINYSTLFSKQQNLSLNTMQDTGLHNQSPSVCQVGELHVLNHLNTSSY